MAKGRKPKPVEQKIREGNPGKRKLPEKVEAGGPPDASFHDPPAHLDEDAAAFWRDTIPVLEKAGLLDVVDHAALEMAAVAFSRYCQARRLVERDGITIWGSGGTMREHPSLGTERQAMATFLRFAEQYALTPVARTRLGMADLQRRELADRLESDDSDLELEPVGEAEVVAA